MNDEIKLSIILPVYNGGDTLHRPLQSILNQNFPAPYEVVIINDNSQDNSLEVINKYLPLLPIKLINVNLDVHCAGNSRNIGLENCKGEWITFIDQDDEFEPDAFLNVFKIIQDNDLKYICCTMLYEYDEDTDKVVVHDNLQDNIDVWLHGKYYNRKNFIEAFPNIRFKKDLKYLEDLYFNNQALQVLFELNLLNKPTYVYYIVNTYKWYEHSKSTHNKRVEGNYVFNHWGIANHYCDVVFPSLLEMRKSSKNLESDYALLQMAYADIAYLYVQYNVLVYNYGQDDKIVKSLEDNICKYLPTFLTLFRITNIFDHIDKTIEFTIGQAELTEEQKRELMIYTFPLWWNKMLTMCSKK